MLEKFLDTRFAEHSQLCRFFLAGRGGIRIKGKGGAITECSFFLRQLLNVLNSFMFPDYSSHGRVGNCCFCEVVVIGNS